MHYLLFYETAERYVERRQPYRAEHLGLALAARERGELLMGGAFDPADGALLLFTTQESARAFAQADPYVANGLVTRWYTKKWVEVVADYPTE